MSQLLFENPWVLGIAGLFIVIALVIGWIQAGQPKALWVAIGFLALTVLGVSINLWVVTDREVITAFTNQAAAELQNNRFEKISVLMHPSATPTVKQAVEDLPRCKFTVAKVTNLHEIIFDYKRQPIRAIVKLNVFVDGSLNGYQAKVPRYVELTLYKSGDHWLVQDFRHAEPMKGFQVESK